MAPVRVLKFARSDDDSASVLLQATPKGSKPLDLKLIATEGEAPYAATLKHDKVSSLRVKNCPASEAEWQTILESLFKQEPAPDIQVSASVQGETSISITVRKQIQGITQRLGSITLKHDPDEEIELFSWCAAAADASTESKHAVATSATTIQNLEVTVKQLTAQLDELVQAKEEDETTLLQKFRDLLNEKKVKIREQQRVLASASFNASFPGTSQPSQPPTTQPARRPAKSRPTKRKQQAKAVQEESGEEDEPQAMDVDVKAEADDTDPGNTTELDASTASEDEEDDDGSTSAPPPTKKAAAQPPPPRRHLPFVNKKPAKPTRAPAAAGDETESDDEL